MTYAVSSIAMFALAAGMAPLTTKHLKNSNK
jgi:hypothetical protein